MRPTVATLLSKRGLHCRAAGGGDSLAAKDALGDDVKASAWLEKHQPGDRSLTQGLKSDATYLIGKAAQIHLGYTVVENFPLKWIDRSNIVWTL